MVAAFLVEVDNRFGSTGLRVEGFSSGEIVKCDTGRHAHTHTHTHTEEKQTAFGISGHWKFDHRMSTQTDERKARAFLSVCV